MKSIMKKYNWENKGLSMVELLIAVAILSIIGASTVAFINQASNTYGSTSAEVDVQTDAQLTANVITDHIIDCETQIKFFDGSISTGTDPVTGDPVTATDSYTVSYLDKGATKDVTDHVLLMTSINRKVQSVIFWDREKKAIYYNETTWNGSSWDSFEAGKSELLADGVAEFEVDTTKLGNKVLEFKLGYEFRGKKYTGSYQVHMRNDVVEGSGDGIEEDITVVSNVKVSHSVTGESIGYITSKRNQPIGLPGTFVAKVTGKGITDSSVTWEMMDATPAQAGVELNGETQTSIITSFRQYGLPEIPVPTVQSFRLRATSNLDPTKAGEAVIYIKRVTGILVEPTSLLRRDDEGNPVSAKNSIVDFEGVVEGWNLTRGERAVTWKLYESVKDASGSYSSWVPANDSGRAAMSGASVVIRNNVNSSYRFKVEATSTFDPAVHSEYIFYISDTVVTSNIQFLRGLNMDLKNYFMANPMAIQPDVTSILSIDKIEITGVSGYTGNFKEFISFDGNYVMYVDYDAYHDGDFDRRNQFYQALTIQLQVDFTTPAGSDSRSTQITLPAVKALKAEPAVADIVIRKGSSSNITVGTQGYNIVNTSQMSAFLDGVKTSGGSSGNQYLSCGMVTTENAKSILGTRENAVAQAKFRLSANTGVRMYPTKPISLIIAVDDYYVVSDKAVDSFVQYNVYVANVEGSTTFIVGPGDPDFPSYVGNNYGSYQIMTRTNSSSGKTDQQLRYRNGRYEMKYNGTSYAYDDTYKYWRKVN